MHGINKVLAPHFDESYELFLPGDHLDNFPAMGRQSIPVAQLGWLQFRQNLDKGLVRDALWIIEERGVVRHRDFGLEHFFVLS